MIDKKLTKYLLLSAIVLAFLSMTFRKYDISALFFLLFQSSLIGLIFMFVGKSYNKQ